MDKQQIISNLVEEVCERYDFLPKSKRAELKDKACAELSDSNLSNKELEVAVYGIFREEIIKSREQDSIMGEKRGIANAILLTTTTALAVAISALLIMVLYSLILK